MSAGSEVCATAFEFVILPLAAVYGAAYVLYVVAPFFCRLIEAARR